MNDVITTKPLKSKTTGLLLTFFFGPLGLFYSTIQGGLFMSIVMPFSIIHLFIKGSERELMIAWVLLIIYYPICLCWSALSVDKYNNKQRGNADLKKYNQQQQTVIPNRHLVTEANNYVTDENASLDLKRKALYDELDYGKAIFERGEISELEYLLQREKLSKKIEILTYNASSLQQPVMIQEDNTQLVPEDRNYIWITILGILLFCSFLYLGYQRGWIFNSHSKDESAIKDQIESTYFGLVNGAYTSQTFQGLGPEGLPFYNQNMGDAMVMGLLPLANILGTGVKLDPENIDVYKFSDDRTAQVRYDLIVQSGNTRDSARIDMTVKKIGGYWKLDGEKALGFNHNKNDFEKGNRSENNGISEENDMLIDRSFLENSSNTAFKIISYDNHSDDDTSSHEELEERFLIFAGRKIYMVLNNKIKQMWQVSKSYKKDESTIFDTKQGDMISSQNGVIIITSPQKNSSIEYDGQDLPVTDVTIDEQYIR